MTGLNRRVQARTAQGAAALGIEQQGMDYDSYVDEGGGIDEQAELDALRVARDMGLAGGAVATPVRERGAHKRPGLCACFMRAQGKNENDVEAFNCYSCGEPPNDHADLGPAPHVEEDEPEEVGGPVEAGDV